MSKEICPVCKVLIEDGAKVVFSCGPSGTRERLWARVCQFIQKDRDKAEACINKEDDVGDILPNDYYD